MKSGIVVLKGGVQGKSGAANRMIKGVMLMVKGNRIFAVALPLS